MDSWQPGLGFERKISYSFVGLLAGDIALLVAFSLITQAWQRSPSYMLGIFPFYITCSLFGWVVIGIPAVLLTNTEFVAGLKLLPTLVTGILLGLAVLVIIFIIYGHLPLLGTRGFFYCWGFSALVACIASATYTSLTRHALRVQKEKDKPIDVPQTPVFSLQDYLRQPQDDTKPFDQK